jgi:hypothetical protein
MIAEARSPRAVTRPPLELIRGQSLLLTDPRLKSALGQKQT